MTNVTPGRPTLGPNSKGRQLLIWALIVIVVILFLRACIFHENKYETIAREMTAALAANDRAGVLKFQNAETATHVTRGIVGRAADKLAPLGKVESAKEIAPAHPSDGVHGFQVKFEHGTLNEEIKFDPEGKVFAFRYDDPVTK